MADPVLGLQVGDKRVIPLLNFERPRPVTRTFTTLRDNQPKALFQFLFKEADRSGWFLAGKIVLDGIPPAPAGRPTFELSLIPRGAGEVLIQLADRTRGAKKRFLLSSSVLQKRRVPVSRLDPGTLALKREAAQSEEKRKWIPALMSVKKVFRGPGLVLVVVFTAAVLIAVVLSFTLPRLSDVSASVASPRSQITPAPTKEITPAPTERRPSAETTRPTTARESGSVGDQEPGADDGGTASDLATGAGVSGHDKSGDADADDGLSADYETADTVSGASPAEPSRPSLEGSLQEGEQLQMEKTAAVRDREGQPAQGQLLEELPQNGGGKDSARDTSYHHIQWGDTLWRITERYYGNPELYPLLAVENDIADPNLIIPGWDIRLPQKIDERERKDAR
ncbi:MAG: hypothetical protein JSV89_20645 [Spirochaetaceae bacterium]|nr:MAG: hypothetical protein JSV89_20645 [Spirochaetaceae bacterium]